MTSILNLTMTLVTRRELVTVLDTTKRSLRCWDLGIGRHSAMRQSIADRVNVCNPTPYVTWNISPIRPESLITCSMLPVPERNGPTVHKILFPNKWVLLYFGQSPVSHCRRQSSIQSFKSMWNLWWTEWHWGRFFSRNFGFPLTSSFY